MDEPKTRSIAGRSGKWEYDEWACELGYVSPRLLAAATGSGLEEGSLRFRKESPCSLPTNKPSSVNRKTPQTTKGRQKRRSIRGRGRGRTTWIHPGGCVVVALSMKASTSHRRIFGPCARRLGSVGILEPRTCADVPKPVTRTSISRAEATATPGGTWSLEETRTWLPDILSARQDDTRR